MPDLHPLLVHFPVALLTFSGAVDLIGWALRKQYPTAVGWWPQLAGTTGILFSVGTGLIAKGHLGDPALLGQLETHEQLAFLTSAIFVSLALWKLSARGRIPSPHYLVFLAAALLLLWGTAWFGGELVYRFGIGVAR